MHSNACLTDQAPGGRLLPVQLAAVRCHVTPRTIRRWIRGGVLPGVALTNRTLRVPEAALEAFTKTATTNR